MENMSNCQVDPNLNAEAYRNMTPADRPPVIDKHLQVVLVAEDEKIFVGASNMTDRYWSGTIWLYENLSFSREEPLTSTRTESGVVDAAALGSSSKYVCGEDSGIIQIIEFSKNGDSNEFRSLGYACQHDDCLTSLSVFQGNSRFVSAAMDYGIKVWDAAELLILNSYQPAHIDNVMCVATQPETNDIFVSVSLDGEALVWDIRNSKPAKSIFVNNCGLTAVDWKPNGENVVALGASNGSVFVIDIRKSDKPLGKDVLFNRGLHRIKYHPEKTKYLAACCDDNIVKIFELREELVLVHADTKHNDFVRGLAWHKDDLVTCSWDNEIHRRSLTFTDV